MIKRTAFLLGAILFVLAPMLGQTELERRLFELPDVIFTPIDVMGDYEAAYELQVKQPIDHQHPEKGYFYQRVFLSHAGFDRPNVIVTEGYQRPTNRIYELSRLLDANQVDVEHRYFGTSTPEPLDYTYLNLEQETADLHHVRELLGQIYPEDWVSTGISKGGQTTIFYRYFYPEDVTVSVPYVAPLNLELEEKRIYDFLAKVGTDECRQAIYDFQVRVLKERDKILPLLKWYAKGKGDTFNYLGFEAAFEYAVLEYPFSFWQMGHDCSSIPGKDADLDTVIDHFNEVVGLDLFNDQSMTDYASHYYQAGTQMGYYGYQTEPFKGLLKVLKGHPSAIFMPNKMQAPFDPTVIRSTSDWLQKKGNNFIYIYGGIDTWSATAVPPSSQTNSVWFMLPGKDHRTARIASMTPEERKKFVDTLEQWLQMEIE
ncbi:MAG: hypothetical protein H6563_04570 [Lewinellaceae bacterium]|nr:hypothetical protein [Lewinellaceae bacterium]